jgi:hypothetical protein
VAYAAGAEHVGILLLPRQFQVAVVENVNEDHLRKAMWLFPLYLIIINLFVLPMAFGGVLLRGPWPRRRHVCAGLAAVGGAPVAGLFTYLGGLSAASSMIIVETIALSVMMSNHLLMPCWCACRPPAPKSAPAGLPTWAEWPAKPPLAVVLVLLLAYGYYAFVGHLLPLVNIGLVSFAAVAQFVPVVLGGLYWKGGTRARGYGGHSGGLCGVVFHAGAAHHGGAGLIAGQLLLTEGGGLARAGCGRLPCLGWKGSITSRTACSGAGFSTSGCTWACRWPRRPRPWKSARPTSSWTCFSYRTVAEGGRAGKAAAPLPDVRALLTGLFGKKAHRPGPARLRRALSRCADNAPS